MALHFSSTEFHEFMKRNSIRHIRTALYHPSSNRQVERAYERAVGDIQRRDEENLTRINTNKSIKVPV